MPRQIHSRIVIKKPQIIFKSLKEQNVVGLAYDYRDGDGHKAEIDPRQSDKEFFLTCQHELFHLMMPSLTEKQIIQLEQTYGESMWKVVLRLRRKWMSKK